jgi:uncharacterized glyoxalase superfamily protein PhnB
MADPFDALRQPVVPIDPRPEFTADLRRRLLGELGIVPTTGGPMATTNIDATAREVRAHALIPYICVSPAVDALAFYAEAFGAQETLRVVAPDGRIGHAEIKIGDVRMMLSDEYADIGVLGPRTLGGSGFALYLEVEDCDAVFARAVGAGATSLRDPADQDHGNRTATILDPFGHRWMLSAPVETVSLAEYQRRSAAVGWTATGTLDEVSGSTDAVIEVGYYTFSVPDVARGVAFYGGLFGWAFEPTRDASDGAHLYAHAGNTRLPAGITDDTSVEGPTLYYRVDDLDAMLERVVALGGEVLERTDYASGGNAVCQDDQGVVFQLWQAAPGY